MLSGQLFFGTISKCDFGVKRGSRFSCSCFRSNLFVTHRTECVLASISFAWPVSVLSRNYKCAKHHSKTSTSLTLVTQTSPICRPTRLRWPWLFFDVITVSYLLTSFRSKTFCWRSLMSKRSKLLSPFVEIYTANSMICWSCWKLAVNYQTRITYLWLVQRGCSSNRLLGRFRWSRLL